MDFDNDGDMDLLGTVDGLMLFECPDDPKEEWTRQRIGRGWGGMVSLADFDGDADQDVLLSGGNLMWYEYHDLAASELTRVGVPPNPDVLVSSTVPAVPGNRWAPRIDHTSFLPSAVQDFLILSPRRVNRVTPYGTLLCDHPATDSLVLTSSSPGVPFTVAIPDSCQFLGAEFSAQGLSRGPGGVLALTNALDVRVGTH